MITLPSYALKFLDLAVIYPMAPCKSTETHNVIRHAARVVKKAFSADSVVPTVEPHVDRYDPLRKRLRVTLKKKGLVDQYKSFLIDPGMAIYMSEQIMTGKISKPRIREYEEGPEPVVYKDSSSGVKLSNLIFRQLYPESTRRKVFVDGDTLNLCNWNVYPKPFVSFFNMVRFDGRRWYIKLIGKGETVFVPASSESTLINKLRPGYDKYEEYFLDVSPREKVQLLYGQEQSSLTMVEWYQHLDRLKKWSPTRDLSPYLQECRRDGQLWQA